MCIDCNSLTCAPSLASQFLVGGPGPEENAPAGCGTESAGHLGGVPGWGSTQFHQSGLPQLRAYESEPEGPRAVQLRGRTGQQEVVHCICSNLDKCVDLSLFFLLFLQDHIYKLMKSDSYTRFLRSNVYQDLLLARKKVSLTTWCRTDYCRSLIKNSTNFSVI